MAETGLRGMIGKGLRSSEVAAAIRDYQGVYLAAIGGAGALLASTVRSCEMVAYPDLQSEAIRRLRWWISRRWSCLTAREITSMRAGRRAYLDFVRAEQGGKR